MSLMQREPTAAQSHASQLNSLRSTGPRTKRGKAIVRRNAVKPRPISKVVAHSLSVLGERPAELDAAHLALAEAMQPRDAWEGAWVRDITTLRWRLERLQRAEVGIMALRRRKLQNQRQRETFPAMGSDSLHLLSLLPLVGFTGLPDSPMKFRRTLQYLGELRRVVETKFFQEDASGYFTLLYGKDPGPHAAILRTQFQTLVKNHQEGRHEAAEENRVALLVELDREIVNFEQLEFLYAEEHQEHDPLLRDADVLLPAPELEAIMRYETHLENQIERKLRQFYARRREGTRSPAAVRQEAVEGTPSDHDDSLSASAGA